MSSVSHRNTHPGRDLRDQGDQPESFLLEAGLCYLRIPGGNAPEVCQRAYPTSPKVAKATTLGFFCGQSHWKSGNKRTSCSLKSLQTSKSGKATVGFWLGGSQAVSSIRIAKQVGSRPEFSSLSPSS